jgi:hypothetical protein
MTFAGRFARRNAGPVRGAALVGHPVARVAAAVAMGGAATTAVLLRRRRAARNLAVATPRRAGFFRR